MSSEGKAWLEVCPECFYAQGATLMEQPPLCPEVKRKHQGIPPRMVRVSFASEVERLRSALEEIDRKALTPHSAWTAPWAAEIAHAALHPDDSRN